MSIFKNPKINFADQWNIAACKLCLNAVFLLAIFTAASTRLFAWIPYVAVVKL